MVGCKHVHTQYSDGCLGGLVSEHRHSTCSGSQRSVSTRTDLAEQPVRCEVEMELLRRQRELLAYMEDKLAQPSASWLSPFSARPCPRCLKLRPASGQSAVWAALVLA